MLLLVPITLIDLDHHIIPNVLTRDRRGRRRSRWWSRSRLDALVEHLIAALGAGGFFLLAAIVYPAGMGMGDVKLAG